jgi:hypothetical protein
MKGKSVTEVKYSGDEGKGVLSLVSESAIIGSVNFTGNYVHARFSITYSGSDSLIRLIDFNGPANGTYPETQQLNPTPPSSGGVTNNTTISNTTVKNTTINNTTVNNTTNINVISAVNANPSLRFIDTTIDAQAARLYQAAFDRAPDSAGLAYWANALAQGSSLLAIAGGFVASAEFQGRYSVSDRGGLVAGFYRNVLGREPDAAGTAYWKAALDNGSATPEQVLCGFSESIENKCHVPDAQTASVARLYYAELGRAPDAAGLSFWTSGLAVGTASLQDEASALASSPEFIGRYGALDDAGFVNQLYRNVLGRDGDAQGVAAWTANLAGAAPRGSVVIGFSESQEFKDKFVTTIAENGIQLS